MGREIRLTLKVTARRRLKTNFPLSNLKICVQKSDLLWAGSKSDFDTYDN